MRVERFQMKNYEFFLKIGIANLLAFSVEIDDRTV